MSNSRLNRFSSRNKSLPLEKINGLNRSTNEMSQTAFPSFRNSCYSSIFKGKDKGSTDSLPMESSQILPSIRTKSLKMEDFRVPFIREDTSGLMRILPHASERTVSLEMWKPLKKEWKKPKISMCQTKEYLTHNEHNEYCQMQIPIPVKEKAQMKNRFISS